MSERYQSGRIRYSIAKNKDRVSITFDDRFGKRFIANINLKELFPKHILQKYKTRKKDNDKIELKLKKQQTPLNTSLKSQQKSKNQNEIQCGQKQQQVDRIVKSTKIDHSQLINWFEETLQLDYCYFKSLSNNSHVSRNKRFKAICSQQVFRQLYPEIRCIIMIESQKQTITSYNSTEIKFIEEKQEEQPNFSNGQLIIYIERQKKHTIKEVVKYLQTYTTETIVFPLDQYIGMPKLRKEEISINQIVIILEKVTDLLKPQIKSMAKQARLLTKSIEIYAPHFKKYQKFQQRVGLQIKLQGMFQSLPQFYFNLCSLFKQYPLTIGNVQNIQFTNDLSQVQAQYRRQDVQIFFGSHRSVGILNLKKSFGDWIEFKRSLRKGLYIISQLKGFTLEQMQVLVRQHRQVEIFMNEQNFNDFVNYEYKPIDDKSFFIRCEKETVNKFVTRAFDYLRKNERIQSKRQQFTSQLELFYFNQIIKTQIQKNYPTVGFFIKGGALYSRSRQEDLQDLKIQMLNQKRKFLKKVVRMPCIKQVKRSHLYEIIDNQFQTEKYCNELNVKTIHYLFNQKINVYFRPLSSISQCHELLIPIIDQFYEEFEFFMEKFKENSLSLQRYQKHISGLNQGKSNMDRMVLYSMNKSKFVSEMLVWFVDHDQRGVLDGRKLKWDIMDFVQKYKRNKTLELVISENMWKNQRYFGVFFLELFKEMHRQFELSKLQAITVFYQSDLSSTVYSKLLQTLKRTFQKGQNSDYFSLKSEMRLTQREIEKVIMTQGWSVCYWDNQLQINQNLSVLNSFVFSYEKSRRKKQFKVPLFLKPKQSVSNCEYLLSLEQGIYYKILPNCQITKHQTDKNIALKKFSSIIKTYFNFLEYLVVYMNENETEVESKKMYFWLNTSSMSSNSKNVPGQQKIKRFEINEEQKLIPKKNSEVDIFVKRVDFIPKFIIQTHVDFLNQVKRILPLNVIND